MTITTQGKLHGNAGGRIQLDETFDLERAKRFVGKEFSFKENDKKIKGKVVSAQLAFDEELNECASLILKTNTGEVINAFIYSDRSIKIKRNKNVDI